MALRWVYDPRSRRYRDRLTGRYMREAVIVGLRDAYHEAQTQWPADLAAMYLQDVLLLDADGQRAVAERFGAELWGRLEQSTTAEYLLGVGGSGMLDQAGRAEILDRLTQQRVHFDAFIDDIAAGKVSQAQAATRGANYVGATVSAFEEGRARAHGVRVPAYPGDGSTACRGHCRCHLTYRERTAAWEVTWTLVAVDGKGCADCADRAREWAPLTIPKENAA